jgi:hypothetical protein
MSFFDGATAGATYLSIDAKSPSLLVTRQEASTISHAAGLAEQGCHFCLPLTSQLCIGTIPLHRSSIWSRRLFLHKGMGGASGSLQCPSPPRSVEPGARIPRSRSRPGLRQDRSLSSACGCGLRRAELSALTVEDLQIRQGHWAIVDLVGKGGHVRTVPMPQRPWDWLQRDRASRLHRLTRVCCMERRDR